MISASSPWPPVLLGLLLHLPEAPMATFFARHVARLTELLGRRPSAEARDRAEAFLPPTLAFGIVEAATGCSGRWR